MSIRMWLVKRQVRKLFRPKWLETATSEQIGNHFIETLTSIEPTIPSAPKDAHIETIDRDGVKGDWIWAPRSREDRVLYYIHGGGYGWGSPRLYHEFAYRLSKATKARVFLLDYGLAPDVVAPTQLNESLAAYDYIRAAYPDASFAIAGDSAGGGLSASTMVAIRDSGRPKLVAAALIAPWVDITGSGESMQSNWAKDTMLDARGINYGADRFRGDLQADDPIVSPLFADQHDMPPTLFQVGEDEILRDDSVRLAAKIKEAGGEADLRVWPKVYHVWHRGAMFFPEGRKAIMEFAEFLEKHWK